MCTPIGVDSVLHQISVKFLHSLCVLRRFGVNHVLHQTSVKCTATEGIYTSFRCK